MNRLYDLDRNYLNMLLTRMPTMNMLDKKKNHVASLNQHKAATEQIGQLNGCLNRYVIREMLSVKCYIPHFMV